MFLLHVQDLKDYMRQAGEVTYADAHKQRRNEGYVYSTRNSCVFFLMLVFYSYSKFVLCDAGLLNLLRIRT